MEPGCTSKLLFYFIQPKQFKDGNIIKHASREIKTETQILKRELDKELSSKVNKRLKSNEQKLNNIRSALKDLETDNEYVSSINPLVNYS